MMRVVINHLTRMRKGFICVAGLNLANKRHVRPILNSHLRYEHLRSSGGLFELGAVIELGSTKHVGKIPEVEDHEFWLKRAQHVGTLPPNEFWSLLQAQSQPHLVDIFGPDLKPTGKESAAVEKSRGRVSLGCLRLEQKAELFTDTFEGRDRIRMRLKTGKFPLNLSVTDIRLYADDYVTPNPNKVEWAQQQLQQSSSVILSVGLSRLYSSLNSPLPEMHWLQVNNLHFAELPYWK